MNSTTATTSTTLPPPQHPSTTTGTSASTGNTVNDGTTGNAAAQGLGGKIKGGWNVFHGVGEGIRGNINSFVDNVGEQIAGRGNTSATPATRTEGGQRPEQVASNGADELRAGMANIQK